MSIILSMLLATLCGWAIFRASYSIMEDECFSMPGGAVATALFPPWYLTLPCGFIGYFVGVWLMKRKLALAEND